MHERQTTENYKPKWLTSVSGKIYYEGSSGKTFRKSLSSEQNQHGLREGHKEPQMLEC